jgi:hypothetical protein
MSELTKEYFDEQLNALNNRIDGLPTREESKALETKLAGVKEPVERIDNRDLQDSGAFAKDLVKHDRRITRLEKHLNLKATS